MVYKCFINCLRHKFKVFTVNYQTFYKKNFNFWLKNTISFFINQEKCCIMDGQVLKERLSKLTDLTQMELAEKLNVSQLRRSFDNINEANRLVVEYITEKSQQG